MSINDINNAAAAMNQLKARYEGFLDDADEQIAARRADYDGLASDLDLVARLAMSRRYHLSSLGDDNNDGLSAETPKLTLDAIRAITSETAFIYLYVHGTAENPFVIETTIMSNRCVEFRPAINGGELHVKWRGTLVFEPRGYFRTLYNTFIEYDGNEFMGHMLSLQSSHASIGGFNAVKLTVKNDPNLIIARCSYSVGGFSSVYAGRLSLLNELGDPYEGVATVLGLQSSAGFGSTELWQCSMGPNYVHLGTEIAPNKHITG